MGDGENARTGPGKRRLPYGRRWLKPSGCPAPNCPPVGWCIIILIVGGLAAMGG